MTDQDRVLFAAASRLPRPAPFDIGEAMQRARQLRAEALKGFLARAIAGLGHGRTARPSPAPCGSAG